MKATILKRKTRSIVVYSRRSKEMVMAMETSMALNMMKKRNLMILMSISTERMSSIIRMLSVCLSIKLLLEKQFTLTISTANSEQVSGVVYLEIIITME